MKTDKLTGPTNDAVAGLPGAEKAGPLYRSWVDFEDWADEQGYGLGKSEPGSGDTYASCMTEAAWDTWKKLKCPVPPVNVAESGSSTGQESPTLEQEDFRTQVQKEVEAQMHQNTEALFLMGKALALQYKKLEEVQDSVKFLAEQVKTLIDGLAEDADPDEPPKTYMSGRPI